MQYLTFGVLNLFPFQITRMFIKRRLELHWIKNSQV